MPENRLSLVLDIPASGPIRLERQLLKDRAADLLRARIINGSIPPGTRLTEREVGLLLGISRAPARDALNELEKEGLIVGKANTRCVTELSEDDIRDLHAVRLAMEKLAAELAARHMTPQYRAELNKRLQEMKDAVARGDARACVTCDIQAHRLIWRQSQNQRLVQVAESVVGPIFGFIASSAQHYDWQKALALHRETTEAITSGDPVAAAASMERHLQSGLESALLAFRQSALAKRATP